MKKTSIMGIGNVLLSDDGAGVHVARLLAQRLAGRDDVEVLDGGTLSFTLAPLISGSDRLIVLDATELEQSPGTVRTFIGAEVDRMLGRARLTVHEIGLRDVLAISQLAGELPQERALIAIQPASLAWGTEPTPAVALALECAAGTVLELLALEHWAASSGCGAVASSRQVA
ncbi:MAG TPA: HyaD/HybD family hydrogenase maturation endopeptidase [Steroidobacteraceae bacterium]|nr:HyaD/HybD family hydrogenase maturation endopeptidase [Steroidobacteraceae bacterium]